KHEGPVVDVVMRLLSREPDDRPSAAQAREAFAAVSVGGDSGLAPLAAAVPIGTAVVPPVRSGQPTLSDARPAAPARPRPPRRNRQLPVLLAALAVLALGAGVIAAILTSGGAGADTAGSAAAQPATTSAPAVPAPTTTPQATTAPPTTAPSPTSATAAPTTPPTSGSSAPSDVVSFVQNYYSLLPG